MLLLQYEMCVCVLIVTREQNVMLWLLERQMRQQIARFACSICRDFFNFLTLSRFSHHFNEHCNGLKNTIKHLGSQGRSTQMQYVYQTIPYKGAPWWLANNGYFISPNRHFSLVQDPVKVISCEKGTITTPLNGMFGTGIVFMCDFNQFLCLI